MSVNKNNNSYVNNDNNQNPVFYSDGKQIKKGQGIIYKRKAYGIVNSISPEGNVTVIFNPPLLNNNGYYSSRVTVNSKNVSNKSYLDNLKSVNNNDVTQLSDSNPDRIQFGDIVISKKKGVFTSHHEHIVDYVGDDGEMTFINGKTKDSKGKPLLAKNFTIIKRFNPKNEAYKRKVNPLGIKEGQTIRFNNSSFQDYNMRERVKYINSVGRITSFNDKTSKNGKPMIASGKRIISMGGWLGAKWKPTPTKEELNAIKLQNLAKRQNKL
jgi:hypothetical protein